MNNLIGFGLPFIYSSKSDEEKIAEAKASGLINPINNQLVGQKLFCKNCGSPRVKVTMPVTRDLEKSVEIPYECQDCHYVGYQSANIKNIKDGKNGAKLVVELIPDSLIGVPQYTQTLSIGD